MRLSKYLTIDDRIKLIDDIRNGDYLIKEKSGKIVLKHDKTLFSDKCDILEILEKISDVDVIGKGSYGKAYKVCQPKDDCENEKNLKYSIKEIEFNDLGTYNPIIENPDRFENVEVRMLQLLSEFVYSKATPHINLPILTFVCVPDNNNPSIIDKYRDKTHHLDKIKRFTVSEIADRGDLYSFINSKVKKIKGNVIFWKILFFQILSTLSIILQYYPNFLHNDLKPNNILVKSTQSIENGFYKYKVNGTDYYVPDVGFQILFWDFDFAVIAGKIDNDKLIYMIDEEEANLTVHKNQYYDIRMLFGNIRKYWEDDMPEEIYDWLDEYVISRLLPSAQRDERLLEAVEYTTPDKLLNTPLFESFKNQPSSESAFTIIESYTGTLDQQLKYDFGDNENRYTVPQNCSFENFVFFVPKNQSQSQSSSRFTNRYKCKLSNTFDDIIESLSSYHVSQLNSWMNDTFKRAEFRNVTRKELANIISNTIKFTQQYVSLYNVPERYLYLIAFGLLMYSSYITILSYISPFNNFKFWYQNIKLKEFKRGQLEDVYKQICEFVATHIEHDS